MNCRTLLRRNWRGEEAPEALVEALKRDAKQVVRAASLQELLGTRRRASRYFGAFGNLIKRDTDEKSFAFDFTTRNRRPPTTGQCITFLCVYSAVRTWTVALKAVGFDNLSRFLSSARYGRPALALDMMEPFRPLIADSGVLSAIIMERSGRAIYFSRRAVALTSDGRKAVYCIFGQKVESGTYHPVRL